MVIVSFDRPPSGVLSPFSFSSILANIIRCVRGSYHNYIRSDVSIPTSCLRLIQEHCGFWTVSQCNIRTRPSSLKNPDTDNTLASAHPQLSTLSVSLFFLSDWLVDRNCPLPISCSCPQTPSRLENVPSSTNNHQVRHPSPNHLDFFFLTRQRKKKGQTRKKSSRNPFPKAISHTPCFKS